MAKIFLCHASEDKLQVREVYQRLKAEGFEPWLDEEDLLPGQMWDQEIRKALKQSDFILIFFSQSSIAKRGYVQREMKLALEAWEEIPEGQIHTIPIRLDDCAIPERFRRFQWLDLFDARRVERLLRALQVGVSQLPKQEPDKGRLDLSKQFRRIYYESFDSQHLKPQAMRQRFGKIWLFGKRGKWQGQVADGVYTLWNTAGTDAVLHSRIRYYEPEDHPVELGDCKVSVKVQVEPPNDGHSGGGLLFRMAGEEKHYYAFFLNAGNNVSFAITQSNKLSFLWSQEISEIDSGTFTTLQIIGHGQQLDLYVNNTCIYTATDTVLCSGDPGVIALSIGKYVFDDFTIYQRLR